jgi:hypothetical protein
MAEFWIWGRLERCPKAYRAVAAAIPTRPGVGPDVRDIREAYHPSPGLARATLHALAHDLARTLHGRGDRISRVDLAR